MNDDSRLVPVVKSLFAGHVPEDTVFPYPEVSVEEREGVRFVGLDAGWTIACERFIYRSDLQIVLCRAADAAPAAPATIAGNINEGNDLFAEDLPFPEVREGDVVAMLGLGSYNASMYTEHCLRPPAATVAFAERR